MNRFGVFALTTFVLSGCDLWWTDDDCDQLRAGAVYDEPSQSLRNPQTGLCESYGPYPYPCSEECGPCPDYAAGDQAVVAPPTWATCGGICEGLAEADCL